MKLEIHYREMSSTDGIKNHIEKKAEKLEKFVTEGELIRVIVGADKHKHIRYAEIFWHDKQRCRDFFAKDEGADLYTQIDQVFDKIIHQLEKEHDKDISRHHKKEPLKKILSAS